MHKPTAIPPLSSPYIDVVFLDFDGVLQTPALPDWVEMEHAAGLCKLLNGRPRLHVVVSSTHREGRSLQDLRRLLPYAISERVIGATPVTPLGRARGGRQQEIRQWLSAREDVKSWVAVDDEPFLFEPSCEALVVTHALIGWTEQTSEEVEKRLQLSC